VLLADVVGTKGRTQITGQQLQSLFGLQTTLASFTTISTNAGAPPQRHGRRGGAAQRAQQAEAQAVLALPALVRDIVSGAVPGLHGTIMPARRGDALTIQERQGSHGWKTVAHTTVGAGGSYGLQLPGPGTYRVVYGSFSGPGVAVS
jgi:hypothetical protein